MCGAVPGGPEERVAGARTSWQVLQKGASLESTAIVLQAGRGGPWPAAWRAGLLGTAEPTFAGAMWGSGHRRPVSVSPRATSHLPGPCVQPVLTPLFPRTSLQGGGYHHLLVTGEEVGTELPLLAWSRACMCSWLLGLTWESAHILSLVQKMHLLNTWFLPQAWVSR